MNGFRAVILELLDHYYAVRNMKTGRVTSIPRTSNEILVNWMKVIRRQFPLILGYAVTVHAAQGKNLQRVVFKASNEIFAQGQLYVALS